MTWEGIIPRKWRKLFAKFLSHHDSRSRALAEQMQAQDRAARKRLVDLEFDEVAP